MLFSMFPSMLPPVCWPEVKLHVRRILFLRFLMTSCSLVTLNTTTTTLTALSTTRCRKCVSSVQYSKLETTEKLGYDQTDIQRDRKSLYSIGKDTVLAKPVHCMMSFTSSCAIATIFVNIICLLSYYLRKFLDKIRLSET